MTQIELDDFFWMPTDPPFVTKRPVEERVRQNWSRKEAADRWVLTGSGRLRECDKSYAKPTAFVHA